MTDPLSLLRQYKSGSLEIIERDDQVIFGEFSWPKSVKTKFRVGNKKVPKEYYTLECLIYYLKYYDMIHPEYVRQAAAENVQAVYRPDRKVLLQYLFGELETCASIEQSAPETSTQLKRTHGQGGSKSKAKKRGIGNTSESEQNDKRKKRKKNKHASSVF